ncbi:MAG: hypothetical protein AAF637_25835, partial [Pseudomonadota bacterium]
MPQAFGATIGRFGLIAAGGYAFGPVGAAAGAVLGGFLFGSSGGPDIEGPRLGDLDVSAATYGGVIPLGFGVQKVAGTLIWATDIEEEKRTRTEGEGIFGWGGQDVTEYLYYANFAVAFGEGPAVDVLRLWAGSKLILDRRDPVAAMPEGWNGTASLFTGQARYKVKIHLGSEDQEPDGLIVRKVLEETGEAHAVPAHRGLVYVVFDRLPLVEWNNRIPPITAEIAWSGERPATVRNATFLPHDGGASFQRGGMAVDHGRGYLYLEGNGGMHRIRTRDMQEDLHVTEAQMGAPISPALVDSRGNLYSAGITTIQKLSGNNYQLLATASGQNNPTIDLMWGTTPLGWRYDFLLVMS